MSKDEGYSIISMHDPNEDFFFVVCGDYNFYDMARVYADHFSHDVGTYPLESHLEYFGYSAEIFENVFDTLCQAKMFDENIHCALKFDFEEEVLSVCEDRLGTWLSYSLEDVCLAAKLAGSNEEIPYDVQLELFAENLAECELSVKPHESAVVVMTI